MYLQLLFKTQEKNKVAGKSESGFTAWQAVLVEAGGGLILRLWFVDLLLDLLVVFVHPVLVAVIHVGRFCVGLD